MTRDRFLPVFSIVFVALYAACVYFNWAAFTYFPKDGKILAWAPAVAKVKGAIPMFWYGWLTTSIVGSLIIAGAITFTPASRAAGAGSVLAWIVPIASIGVVLYALRTWFML
jgi:hypothetical protein